MCDFCCEFKLCVIFVVNLNYVRFLLMLYMMKGFRAGASVMFGKSSKGSVVCVGAGWVFRIDDVTLIAIVLPLVKASRGVSSRYVSELFLIANFMSGIES